MRPFLSPEQGTGQSQTKVDFWSVAALVIYMLSPPDKQFIEYSKQSEETLHSLVAQVIPTLEDKLFRQCLVQMLKKEPNERICISQLFSLVNPPDSYLSAQKELQLLAIFTSMSADLDRIKRHNS